MPSMPMTDRDIQSLIERADAERARNEDGCPAGLMEVVDAIEEAEGVGYVRMIVNVILPGLLSRFAIAAGDYRDAYKLLGEKGQFSDINRKYWKLKHAVWDGQSLEGEDVNQIAEDIICHCLLLLLIRWENGVQDPAPTPPAPVEEKRASAHEGARSSVSQGEGAPEVERTVRWDDSTARAVMQIVKEFLANPPVELIAAIGHDKRRGETLYEYIDKNVSRARTAAIAPELGA